MNFPKDEEYIIRPLTTDDTEQYNALLCLSGNRS